MNKNQETYVCPVCESDKLQKITPLNLKLGNQMLQTCILSCSSCTHRFMPTTEIQQQFIEQNYDVEYVGFWRDPFFTKKIEETLTNEIHIQVAPPASVLDVGCGNGEFMKIATEYGYQIEGVDVSEQAISLCHQNGLKARVGNFLTLDFNQYDLITMWDVVEHLRNPASFIQRAKEILKPNGVLLLKIPGFNRLTFFPIQIWHRLAVNLLSAPNHVQYFTPKSLTILLNRCGFTDIDWMSSRNFRSVPATNSLKKKTARTFVKTVKQLSGDRNLYLVARREN